MPNAKQRPTELRFFGGTRRACDSCRRRKVRCDGRQPCSSCRDAFECLYFHTPKKKGPKPARTETSDDVIITRPQQWGSPNRQTPSPATTAPRTESFDSLSEPWDDIVGPLDSSTTTDDTSSGVTDLLLGPLLLPFVELFFEHLFSIMPVLDRNIFLDPELYQPGIPLSHETYCLLTSLAALTIAQLNLPQTFVQQNVPTLSAEWLVEKCLRTRSQYDYIESSQTSTIMTSFFLFGYYGHLERHRKALYYLHEAISIAESLDLDDEDYLSQLDPREGQWRRRIFWLLFVTERAYSIQRRTRIKINNLAIELPAIFESEEPRLLYGFVNLIRLFLQVDETFLALWNGRSEKITCSKTWVLELQKKFDTSAVMLGESIESQLLDIAVTRQWLHALGWQISARYGLLSLTSDEEQFNLKYPVQLGRELVCITSRANQSSLDSHGIGMEQKLSSVAGILVDVLQCGNGDTSEFFVQCRDCLFSLIQQLANIRGGQSRYLQPLIEKYQTPTDLVFPSLPPSPPQCYSEIPASQLTDLEAEQDLLGGNVYI